LDLLPIQKCWPEDAAPFITLPAVITKDPRTGTRNVGMYRMQKLGPRATAMHWQIHKDGRADYLATDGKIEVAVALGTDPVTTYTASATRSIPRSSSASRRPRTRGSARRPSGSSCPPSG